MWCTQCHTGFSWRTGAIQRRVHNPHFFEWQRNNNGGVAPRRPGDIECGRDLGDSRALMSIRRCLRAIDTSSSTSSTDSELKNLEKTIETTVRGVIHLGEVQANRFRTDELVNNQDLRLRYLEKTISEKKLKSDILRRDKAFEKKQDIYNVIQLEIRAVTDIIYRLEDAINAIDRDSSIGRLSMKTNALELCNSHIREINNVTEYCNNLFKEHSRTYNCKDYKIDFSTNMDNRSTWRVNDVLV
jgi:vacuolar-type H+-ATPase subunit I/STV1